MPEASQIGVLESRNPATGELLGTVPLSTPEAVLESVAVARAKFQDWSRLSLDERLAYIEKFRALVFANGDQLAELITRETGKPLVESWVTELFGPMETAKWLRRKARKLLAPHSVSLNRAFFPLKKLYNQFEPLGVVAVISPWNYPFSIPVSTMLCALAAGNTVVLKPSPKTPMVSQFIERLFAEVFPEGTVHVVYGDRDQAKALVESDVDRVVFTGSVNGGKAIMGMCVNKLHPPTLELGGKHPAIVCRDVDINKVAKGIVWCAFTNAGQACASIERLYVPKSILHELENAIISYTSELRVGNGMDPTTDVGPMIDGEQPLRLQRLVADAVSGGARVLYGGEARPDMGGHFFEPTVLTNVDHSMAVIREEIFGPLLPIVPVEDEEEAVRLANDSQLALGASVWCKDRRFGEALAKRIQSGMVWVNDGLYTHCCPDAPWGGRKNSGFGRTHGPHALLDFVHMKSISVDRQGARDWYFPYSKLGLSYIKTGTAFCHAGLGTQLLAVPKLAAIKVAKFFSQFR